MPETQKETSPAAMRADRAASVVIWSAFAGTFGALLALQ